MKFIDWSIGYVYIVCYVDIVSVSMCVPRVSPFIISAMPGDRYCWGKPWD